MELQDILVDGLSVSVEEVGVYRINGIIVMQVVVDILITKHVLIHVVIV